MNQIPYIPETAPFDAEQRAWLNGFLAGLYAHQNSSATATAIPAIAAEKKEPLKLLFGSQTGTAEGLAKRIAKESEKKGFSPQIFQLNDYAKADLQSGGKALIISSTWGDGEAPDNAVEFWNWIQGETAPRLDKLDYAVLGLGDRNYSDFCGASKKFDTRLEALGARRLIDRAECDVEYEATAKTWTELLWQKMTPANGASHVANSGGTTNGVATTTETQPDLKTKGAFSKTNPFPSKVLHSRLLNGAGSAKQVYHHEISLKESGLEYQVGDALGVYPKNCPELVSLTLTAAGCTGEENVTVSGEVKLLRDALTNDFDLLKPSGELIAKVAANSKDPLFTHLTGDGKSEELKKWLFGRDVTDILTLSGKKIEVTELVPLLRKLSPRLYSISSSPKAHPDEVHLTVGAVRYEVHGRSRKGVASTYLADRISPEERVRVFVQTSHGFRLPTDQSAPIIMVGPGTGIAPFRAFLEEREATGSKGRNWLFFGDQKRSTDYLYQEQIEGWISKGFLTRLDLAFSRDQAEKIYVQDRMAENGREIWDWLQAGAYFYVCGDASRMAKDVDACLHSIIQKEGGMDAGAATLYVSQLKSSKRYQRDVY